MKIFNLTIKVISILFITLFLFSCVINNQNDLNEEYGYLYIDFFGNNSTRAITAADGLNTNIVNLLTYKIYGKMTGDVEYEEIATISTSEADEPIPLLIGEWEIYIDIYNNDNTYKLNEDSTPFKVSIVAGKTTTVDQGKIEIKLQDATAKNFIGFTDEFLNNYFKGVHNFTTGIDTFNINLYYKENKQDFIKNTLVKGVIYKGLFINTECNNDNVFYITVFSAMSGDTGSTRYTFYITWKGLSWDWDKDDDEYPASIWEKYGLEGFPEPDDGIIIMRMFEGKFESLFNLPFNPNDLINEMYNDYPIEILPIKDILPIMIMVDDINVEEYKNKFLNHLNNVLSYDNIILYGVQDNCYIVKDIKSENNIYYFLEIEFGADNVYIILNKVGEWPSNWNYFGLLGFPEPDGVVRYPSISIDGILVVDIAGIANISNYKDDVSYFLTSNGYTHDTTSNYISFEIEIDGDTYVFEVGFDITKKSAHVMIAEDYFEPWPGYTAGWPNNAVLSIYDLSDFTQPSGYIWLQYKHTSVTQYMMTTNTLDIEFKGNRDDVLTYLENKYDEPLEIFDEGSEYIVIWTGMSMSPFGSYTVTFSHNSSSNEGMISIQLTIYNY